MKYYSLLLLLLTFYVNVFAEKIDERGIVLEYRGRQNKEPLENVKLHADGSNWTTSDTKGTFVMRFNNSHVGDNVLNPKVSRSGYIIFNKDAVNQWRLSGTNAFTIVMVKEDLFVDLLKQYYDIYEKNYKREYEQAKAALENERVKSQMQKEEYQKKIDAIEEEYNQKLNDINSYIEIFAYIDESSANEVILKALDLFKQNKLNEALQLYESQHFDKQLEEQLAIREKGKEIIEAGQKVINLADSNVSIIIPHLKQEIEICKLMGNQNLKSLREKLNILIKAYRVIDNESYKNDLSIALCDLGNTYWRKEEWYGYDIEGFDYYKESAELGNSLAQYRVAYMYEHSFNDMQNARLLYEKSADQGNEDAKKRLEEMLDFYSRNSNGIKLYYKILSEKGKTGTVKLVAYTSSSSYSEEITEIPEKVICKNKTYDVVEIGKRAFGSSSIRRIKLPQSILKIDDGAFFGCYHLKEINIPLGIIYLGSNLFNGCSELSHIDFNSNKHYIFENSIIYSHDRKKVITSCRKIKGIVEIPSGVEEIADGAFDGCNYVTYFRLPESLKIIGSEAFADCDSLSRLDIPEGVSVLGNWALRSNNNLMKVSIGSTLETLGDDPFPFCANLHHIEINPNNPYLSKAGPLLMDKAQTKILFCERDVNGTLIMPSSLKDIRPNSVYNCYFNSILLPENVDTIGENSLYFNRSLTMVVPPSVKVIKENGMYCNKDLIELFITDKLDWIDNAALYSYNICPDVYCFSKNPIPSAETVFSEYDTPEYECLHVPAGCTQIYRESKAWSCFKYIVDDLLLEDDFDLIQESNWNSYTFFRKGLLLKANARYTDAIEYFNKAMSTINKNESVLLSDIYWQLGNTHLILGDSVATDEIRKSVNIMLELVNKQDSIESLHMVNRILCAVYVLSRVDFPKNNLIAKDVLNDVLPYVLSYKELGVFKNLNSINNLICEFTEEKTLNSKISFEDLASNYELLKTLFDIYYFLIEEIGCESDNEMGFSYDSFESNLYSMGRCLVEILPRIYKQAGDCKDIKVRKDIYKLCYKYASLYNEEKYKEVEQLNLDGFRASIRGIGYVPDYTRCEKYQNLSVANFLMDSESSISDILHFHNWLDMHADDETKEVRKRVYSLAGLEYYDLEEEIERDINYDLILKSKTKWYKDDSFEQIVSLLRKNSLKEAYEYMKNNIHEGSLSSLRCLAQFFDEGVGMKENKDLACKTYELLWNLGDSTSLDYIIRHYFGTNQYERAYPYLMDSNTPYSYAALGKMYQYGHGVNWDLDKAIYYYRKLDESGYDASDFFESISKIYNEMAYDEVNNNANYTRAIEIIEKAIEICPNNLNYLDTKGEILLKSGDIQKAKEIWIEIKNQKPNIIEEWEDNGIRSILYETLKELNEL